MFNSEEYEFEMLQGSDVDNDIVDPEVRDYVHDHDFFGMGPCLVDGVLPKSGLMAPQRLIIRHQDHLASQSQQVEWQCDVNQALHGCGENQADWLRMLVILHPILSNVGTHAEAKYYSYLGHGLMYRAGIFDSDKEDDILQDRQGAVFFYTQAVERSTLDVALARHALDQVSKKPWPSRMSSDRRLAFESSALYKDWQAKKSAATQQLEKLVSECALFTSHLVVAHFQLDHLDDCRKLLITARRHFRHNQTLAMQQALVLLTLGDITGARKLCQSADDHDWVQALSGYQRYKVCRTEFRAADIAFVFSIQQVPEYLRWAVLSKMERFNLHDWFYTWRHQKSARGAKRQKTDHESPRVKPNSRDSIELVLDRLTEHANDKQLFQAKLADRRVRTYEDLHLPLLPTNIKRLLEDLFRDELFDVDHPAHHLVESLLPSYSFTNRKRLARSLSLLFSVDKFADHLGQSGVQPGSEAERDAVQRHHDSGIYQGIKEYYTGH